MSSAAPRRTRRHAHRCHAYDIRLFARRPRVCIEAARARCAEMGGGQAEQAALGGSGKGRRGRGALGKEAVVAACSSGGSGGR